MTRAQPDDGTFGYGTLTSCYDNRPVFRRATFDDLFEHLKKHTRVTCTRGEYDDAEVKEQKILKDGPAVCLAEFDGTRAIGNVTHVFGLGLDIDEEHVTPEELRDYLKGTSSIIYESLRSTKNFRRWRAFIELARPMSVEEHERAYDHWRGIIPGVSDKARDASRLWYCVQRFKGDPQRILERIEGEPFAVKKARKLSSQAAFMKHFSPPADAPAQDGARNDQLSRYALSVLKDCATEDDLREALHEKNATYLPPLDDREVEAMVKNKWRRRVSLVQWQPIEDEEEVDDVEEEYAPFLDWLALDKNPPELKRAIIDNWLYEGTVALFAGHGGVGKSMLGLQIAIGMALGKPVVGASTVPERVVYYSCEDDATVLYWRAKRICEAMGCSITDLDDKLLVRDFTRSNAIMYAGQNGEPESSPQAMQLLGEDIEGFEATVAFVDNASDVFAGSEVVRAEVRQFIRQLQATAKDCAVVLVAHVDKASAKNSATTEGYSGSTAWNNSVRARWYFYRDENDALMLECQKVNYGRRGEQYAVEFDESVHAFTLTEPERREENFDMTILRALGSMKSAPVATNAPNNVAVQLKAKKLIPVTMAAGVLNIALHKLMEAGLIDQTGRAGANRKEVLHWTLTPAGEAAVAKSKGKF
jgi:archaellum biogenesis ATPase FlaH